MIRTIDTLTRMRSSVNGNPRYEVRFTDGTVASTEVDSSLAYEIGNAEYRRPCEVVLSARGCLVDLRPVT